MSGSDRKEESTPATENGGNVNPPVTIVEKIAVARDRFAAWGEPLREDPRIAGLLVELEAALRTTFETMIELGVVEACRGCEEEEGGSCCGAGIENRYNSTLLLVNLLLGASLPDRRTVERSCFFLGSGGCMLRARHVLCVNYLCDKIETALTHEQLCFLQNTAGRELDLIFALQEAVYRYINR